MDKFQQLYQADKQKLYAFLQKYWIPLTITCLCIIGVIIYYKLLNGRIVRCENRLEVYRTNLKLTPLEKCIDIMKGNHKLCDIYIASSAKSYLPCSQYWDYSSLSAIKHVLLSGARYIELDIYSKNFCENSEPVVCNGDEVGNWHYTTELKFKDAIDAIAEWGFSNLISNRTDPLFLCLNLHTNFKLKVLDKIASIIDEAFQHKLLGPKYGYQRTNIGQVPIRKFINKVIILSNKSGVGVSRDAQLFQESKINELINYSWKQPFMRNLTHLQVKESFEPKELTEYNKKSLSRVYPDFDGRSTENYNPRAAWYTGCQFVCLNYFRQDKFMKINLEKFKGASFILKPWKLRYHPQTYREPKKQDKRVSFKPEKVTTPFYSFTY